MSDLNHKSVPYMMGIIEESFKGIKDLTAIIDNATRGKKAIVISNHNGQPHGSSKKSMKGKEVTIRYAFFSDSYGNVCFFVEGSRVALSIDELDIQWV